LNFVCDVGRRKNLLYRD